MGTAGWLAGNLGIGTWAALRHPHESSIVLGALVRDTYIDISQLSHEDQEKKREDTAWAETRYSEKDGVLHLHNPTDPGGKLEMVYGPDGKLTNWNFTTKPDGKFTTDEK
jgi:hypothetical protein